MTLIKTKLRKIMKKMLLLFVAIIFLQLTLSFEFENNCQINNPGAKILIMDSKKLNGNNISTWFQNNGIFNRNPESGGGGFEWPNGSGKVLRYSSGMCLAAKINSDTLVALTLHGSEYFPGFIDINGIPQGKDDPVYRIYKIVKGDTTSIDYLNWPVNQGAYLDTLGKPFLPGTQTIFFSMTDGYPESHTLPPGSTAPLKAQVQVTNWCYNDYPATDMLNTIISEFKIINRSNQTWSDAIISIWSDECSGEQIAIGCDTNLSLGYSYYPPNSSQYGNNPPAVGFVFLKGPDFHTGNPDDTVYSFIPGRNKRRIKVGYKEIKFSSFNTYNNSDPNLPGPGNYRETYGMMQGLKANGNPWILPGTSTVTKFPFSGDPETGNGWVQYTTLGFGNRRLLMNFGFAKFNPGDTQTILVAQIVSQGINNLNSVSKLKQSTQFVKNIYDQNFTIVSVNEPSAINLADNFILHQNYPNPFNPKTIINYQLPMINYVTLKVYDILGKEVVALVNEKQSAGKYKATFDGSNLPTGIYFYTLKAGDFIQTRGMILLK